MQQKKKKNNNNNSSLERAEEIVGPYYHGSGRESPRGADVLCDLFPRALTRSISEIRPYPRKQPRAEGGPVAPGQVRSFGLYRL